MMGSEMIGAIAYESHPDHVFLSEILITPNHQGAGHGSQLIAGIIAQATKADLPVRLRVLLQSRARALYQRLGFVATGETETHSLMEHPCRLSSSPLGQS